MWLAVAVGGALGAMARYGATIWIGRLHGGTFPWATLAVNVSGCFALGVALRLVQGAAVESPLRAFVTVGLLGAFTTFSTYSYEGVLLLQARAYGRAALYLGGSVAAGVAAVVVGLVVAGVWSGRQ